MRPTIHFNGTTVTPDEFQQRTFRAAAALRAAGIGEGDVVALLMHNTPEAIVLMTAVRHLGAQWCPINWHYKTDEVQYIFDDSGAKLCIADAALLGPLHGLRPHATKMVAAHGNVPGVPAWEALRDAASAAPTPPAPVRGAMFYTSGTTGRPKGIVRNAATPAQMSRALEVRRLTYGLDSDVRALLSAPLYHSAPNAYALTAALESCTLYLEDRFDAEATLRLIDAHKLTHAYLVPTMYVRLLALPAAVRAKYDLSSMRFVASTGSPCPPEVKRAMIEWWGPVINESYGASELGYMTLLTSAQALRKPGSAGPALPGVEIAILDDDGRPLPRGEVGLIYVRQDAFADFTYVNNDTARRAMERGGLKTMGDMGYLDDEGFLFIVDRKADMVISGGVNIYPAEIEAVLHAMPGLADCAVFGIPDEEFGESLAAAVQARPGVVLDADAVRAWVRDKMASYKVPKVVTFHDALPREETGKIFKRKLRAPYWEGRARRV